MEHTNTAFLMVGGMLFALMIMSLIAFVFSSLTALPNEEDARLHADQAAAFNEEYLAYDKKIMYGTDVISVLNKAWSNNEKYINKNGLVFLGGGYNTDHIIDIKVILHSEIKESISIKFVEQTALGINEVEYMGTGPLDYDHGGSLYLAKDIFTPPDNETYQLKIYGSSVWNTLPFATNYDIGTRIGAGEYYLLGEDGNPIDFENDSVTIKNNKLEATNILKQVISKSTVMEQTKKNRDDNKFKPYGWSQATWRPATYYLKTRKFKCKSELTEFNEKTGRIVRMVFEETHS